MRYLVIAFVVALVVMLGLVIDTQSRVTANRPQVSPQSAISATGRVEGVTPEIELRPQLSGRITRVFVQEGQVVEQGEPLVQLDDEEDRKEVALAAADVELAQALLQRLVNGPQRQQRDEAVALYRAGQAEFEQAERTWQRIDALRKEGAVTQQEADDKQARVAALQQQVEAAKARVDLVEAPAREDEVRIENARLQSARARLDLARVQLDRMLLRAPCHGQILKCELETGELIGPTSPYPAVVMADTTRFRVRAFVEEMDAPRVQVGMTAKIRADGLPGQELHGRVARLSPRMARKELWSDRPAERYDTKTREVWIDLQDNRPLVVGLRVDVLIQLPSPSGDPASLRSPAISTPAPDRRVRKALPSDQG